MRAAAAGMAVALALGLLSGCTPEPSGPPVVVLFPGSTGDMWGASAAVLRAELESEGYAVDVRHAGDDIPAQLLQLRAAFEAAPTAIVVAPIEATALAAELARSDDPDVAVISYDRLILDAPEVDYFATFDHVASGRLHAQALLDALDLDRRDPELGPPRIELLAGSGDDPAAQNAFAGALEVLGPLIDRGELLVPSERLGIDQTAVLRGTPATAAGRVEDLLAEGHRLDGVLSPDDAMSAAIAEVLAGAGCEVLPAPDPDAVEPDRDPTPAPTGDPEPGETTGPGPTGPAVPETEEPTEPADEPADPPCRVALTGGGTSLDGARALLADAQTAAVREDPRELARVVAEMVAEVVRGVEPQVTLGAVTDNGARLVPTLLLEPVLLDRAAARELVG